MLSPAPRNVFARPPRLPLLAWPPPPLVDQERRLIVVWSPKSACTAVYVWFASVCDFLDEVEEYGSPHRHRMEVFRRSQRYFDSRDCYSSGFIVIRIIRDPYIRTASIFREAFAGDYADRDAARFGLDFGRGISFEQFLSLVESLDMTVADTHFRPQFHPFEHEREPDVTINVSRQELFSELNHLEQRMRWPRTNFASLGWFHAFEKSRHPVPDQAVADAYNAVIARGSPPENTPFPKYESLLVPEARKRIETIYRADFEAYGEYL